MIIDPRKSNCIIWFLNKSKMQSLNGTPEECVDRIIKYATKYVIDKESGVEKIVQWYKIRLDVTGSIGKLYADLFREKEIEFEAVKIVLDVV